MKLKTVHRKQCYLPNDKRSSAHVQHTEGISLMHYGSVSKQKSHPLLKLKTADIKQ